MSQSPIADTAVRLPASALRPFITHYAGYRLDGFAPRSHRGLPSRYVTLIISLGQPIRVAMPSDRPEPDRPLSVVADRCRSRVD
jgi:hypothetical protein